jgi:hypothetical protein
MDRAELKSFAKPDGVRDFLKGRLELVKMGGATIERAVFGRPPSSLLPKQKVAKHPFSNIMSRVWCGF